jgi:hypothetical protein
MATLDVNPVINEFARTPSATSLVQTVYTTRVTPEQMAEQSRIATAEGLREVAAALAAKAKQPLPAKRHSEEEEDSLSDSSSDHSHRSGAKRRRKSRRKSRSRSPTRSHSDEKATHLLRVELASVMVEKEDLLLEISKLKAQLQPYNSVNNELALIKSAIERLNKDTAELTIAQLEKRQNLFHEEFSEHKALATVASSKIAYADVKSCLLRVINAEVKRSALEDKKLTLTIWYRKSTETTTKVFISSVLVAILSYILYWYIGSWFA